MTTENQDNAQVNPKPSPPSPAPQMWTVHRYERDAIPHTGWKVMAGNVLILDELDKQTADNLASVHNSSPAPSPSSTVEEFPYLDVRERAAVQELCERQGLTPKQVMRCALREYQMRVIGPPDLGPKAPPSSTVQEGNGFRDETPIASKADHGSTQNAPTETSLRKGTDHKLNATSVAHNWLNANEWTMEDVSNLLGMTTPNASLRAIMISRNESVRLAVEVTEQDFIDRLDGELRKRGVDWSDCDGDDDPAVVIANWLAGRLEVVEERWKERIELVSKLGQCVGALQTVRFQVDEACRDRIDKLLEDIGDPSVLWRDGSHAAGASSENSSPSAPIKEPSEAGTHGLQKALEETYPCHWCGGVHDLTRDIRILAQEARCSVSLLQRRCRYGFAHALEVCRQLEARGYVTGVHSGWEVTTKVNLSAQDGGSPAPGASSPTSPSPSAQSVGLLEGVE